MHQNELSPRSPGVPWTVRDAWLGAACLGIWLALAYVAVTLLHLLDVDLSPGLMVSMLELALLVPVWWFTRKKYNAGRHHLGLTGFKMRYLGLGAALLLPAMWINALYETVLSSYNLEVQPELKHILTQTPSPGVFVFAAVIIAPLVEEIFFRGFLFAGLKKRFAWTKAMLISSGLFALLHLRLLAVPPIFILGLIFAYLYQKSGSIWPGVLIHALVNALAVIWVFTYAAS